VPFDFCRDSFTMPGLVPLTLQKSIMRKDVGYCGVE
jgi:hypothetical protein